MNHTTPSAPLQRMFIACAALVAATVFANAQSAPASSSDPAKPDEKITKLNPFVVSSDNDKGYRTEQTLVGSRTAKDLAEIPGSVSIINKDDLDLMVPRRCYVTQQARGGDRYIHALRTRFIPDALLPHFEQQLWPPPAAEPATAATPRARVDVGQRMRAMWR